MIPKIIHRVWMSDELPDPNTNLGKCFYSQEKLKDYGYEIKTYNSHNFDFSISPYLLQAYALKKWAFVTDYIRFWTIYHFGGIYMDADVQVNKSFDELLSSKYFFTSVYKVWENNIDHGKNFPCISYDMIFDPAIFGAEKHNIIIKHILDYFNTINFIDNDGVINYQILDYKVSSILNGKNYNIYRNYENIENYIRDINKSDINKDIYTLNTEFLADVNNKNHNNSNSICAHMHCSTWFDEKQGLPENGNFYNLSEIEKEEYYKRYEENKLTSIEFNKVYTFEEYNNYSNLFKTDNFEKIKYNDCENVITNNICFINFNKIDDIQLFKYLLKNLPKDKKCISINSDYEIVYNKNINFTIIKENLFTCIYE